MTDAEIEAALRNSGGFLTGAAQQLGCTHQAVSKRIAKSEKLQAIRRELDEAFLDLAETSLMRILRDQNHDKHFSAICFFLKCKGKQRGYVERSAVEHEIPEETGVILIAPPEGDDGDGA